MFNDIYKIYNLVVKSYLNASLRSINNIYSLLKIHRSKMTIIPMI